MKIILDESAWEGTEKNKHRAKEMPGTEEM